MSDFDLDGIFVEPRPDEDAWEAFLDLALERIGGPRSSGLTNVQIRDLENLLGCQLPFEIGLMLVMGVPADDPWRQWTDPQAELAAWNEHLVSQLAYRTEHHGVWSPDWGPKPSTSAGYLEACRELVAEAPALFPIYGDHAVPLSAASSASNSDGNPIMQVRQGEATVLGDDLAAWMHRLFDVPLPMWPAEQRVFSFWSDPPIAAG